MGPVGGAEDEGDELAGYFVDDYVAGVFAAGLAGYYGGGWDAYQGGYEGRDCCGYGQDCGGWVKGVGGGQPEEDGGYAGVGSGAGFEEACAEEGADVQAQMVFFSEGGWSWVLEFATL